MSKLRVGIDGTGFNRWGGGVDFIATIAEALESTGKVQTYLIVGAESWLVRALKMILYFIRYKGNIELYRGIKNVIYNSNTQMIDLFRIYSPNTKVLTFKKIDIGIINNRERKQLNCLIKNKIECILPSMKCENSEFPIVRIGYIYDFQHKYYPNYFSIKEIEKRDIDFRRQLNNCEYVLVNAQAVKNDIEKFFPNSNCKIIVLPFKPFQKPVGFENVRLDKYNLPRKYYVVCNQFWMHKSHDTVFEALEEVYNKGITDIHIVCTGKLEDARNPEYVNKLKNKISLMECRNNIHLLGFIPKLDRIAIMNGAIGLIQPTLFEGGPGGGATYNALCLGKTCILSDIPVNREVVGYENVYFFEKRNSAELAKLIVEHVNDRALDEIEVENKIAKNKKEYGEILLSVLTKIVNE